MKVSYLLIISVFCFACNNKKEKFSYETTIGYKVYEAQIDYLDKTLLYYSNLTKQGQYFFQASTYIDTEAELFKKDLKNGKVISDDEKIKFLSSFEKTFTNHYLIDSSIFKLLKSLQIQTISDIDLLRLYLKNNFVSILLNNKLLPFDTWGILSFADTFTINKGEEFKADLATIASSSTYPNEWFLVHEFADTIAKENIIDTLFPDRFGIVNFKTKRYKSGENKLKFMTRLNTPSQDNILSRQITLFVK
jgi:hypothetical protein